MAATGEVHDEADGLRLTGRLAPPEGGYDEMADRRSWAVMLDLFDEVLGPP